MPNIALVESGKVDTMEDKNNNRPERPKTGATLKHSHFNSSSLHNNNKTGPPSPTVSKKDLIAVESCEKSGDNEVTNNEETVGCCGTCCAPESSPIKAVLKLCACAVAGIVFGWSFEKSRVFEPETIRYQMVFKRWIMLKMFLAAVAAGQLVMSALSVIPNTKERFQRSVAAFTCGFDRKGLLTTIIGPFVLGSGMTLAGACPGMVLSQVGTWTKNSIYTFIGALFGALLYGLFAPYIIKFTMPKNPFKYSTVHDKLHWPYIAVALPMALLLATTVFLMEWFIPWQEDLPYYNQNNNATADSSNIFTLKSWPPSAAGSIIGTLQIIIIFAVADTLGGSSSYVTLVSQWVVTKKLQALFPYMAKARCGLGNWWQVIYVSAAILGALFSALASDSLATTKGATIVAAIFGGFLMLLGSRFGAGCTSGHGLSGMGLCCWLSFVAVPAMFGGGIVTGFAMQATGALDDFICHSGHQYQCD